MGYGPQEWFCENPKCPHHRICHANQMFWKMHNVQVMWFVPPMLKDGPNVNMDAKAPNTIETTEVERVRIEGAHGISGWFCEVCAEAIRAVEGF
ncbi:hypothetical protein DLP3_044 [Stenotrophomonas phage vB_SmaS_DLP_3]|nr:hypothetical protein DLP3_044 [Stenotrophomonas phage vB_SmaS_DLP_3]